MKLASSAQMKELDSRAINEADIPSSLLMTTAAGFIAGEAGRCMPDGGTCAIFCGSGNNGGDGIAAGAQLLLSGWSVRIFMVGSESSMTTDTAEMASRFKKAGGILEGFVATDMDSDYISSCDVIIDAMLGIGLNKPLAGNYLAAAELINASNAFVISADIPTGVSADTGLIMGSAVKADRTVTFTLPKPGHYVEPGCVYCGEIVLCDIGIPKALINELEADAFAVTEMDVSLPRRRPDTHKGDYGRDYILAGSVGYTGAPIMASDAALRMGAGLIYLGVPDSIYSIAAIKCTEVMPMPVPCDEDGLISWSAKEVVDEMLEKCDVCLAGPGLGRSYQLDYLIEHIVEKSKIPVVLDADGINAVSKNIDVLNSAAFPVVLTPHPGEFAGLGGDLSGGRLQAAKAFAQKYGCILVLKGHRTITALPDGRTYVNTTGGPAMAKGGSGDVLAGMVASLIGQKLPADKACITAVYLHGLVGDLCTEKLGEYSVTASDLIIGIADAVKTIMR